MDHSPERRTVERERSPVLLAHTLLVLVTLVWGSTFPLIKSALHDVSPLFFNFLRMLLATLVLGAFHARSLRRFTVRELRFGAVAGLFLGLGYEFQTAGLVLTTATKSAFITGLVVVLVPLLSMLPGVRTPGTPRPGLLSFAGALLAFGGVALLTSQAGVGHTLFSGFRSGELLTLACAFFYAAHLLTLARAARHMEPGSLGLLQIGCAALLMFFLLPLGGRPTFQWSHTAVLALLITSLLATAAAFTVQSWAQRFISAPHAALLLTLEPVFAWLTSLLFLGERLGTRGLSGAGLILLGILLAEAGPTLFGMRALQTSVLLDYR